MGNPNVLTYEEMREGAVESFLLDLSKVHKASALYPPTHPTLLAMFVKPFKDITDILDETDNIALVYKRGDGFYLDDAPVGRRYQAIKEFGEELFRRRIHSVLFKKGLKLLELHSLVDVINVDPTKIQDMGGCENLLHSKGVRNIWFNEIDYKKILEKQEEEKEKALEIVITSKAEEKTAEGIYSFIEEEESRNSLSFSAPTEAPKAAGTASIHVKKEDELPSDVDSLIKLWNNSSSFSDFERVGNALIGHSFTAASNREGKIVINVMSAFLSVADMMKEERFGAFAAGGLERMASGAPLDLLLDKACSKQIDNMASVEIVAKLKEKAAERVTNRLAVEEDPHSRRVLGNLLVRMGSDILPQLVERTRDERWYMVRNMVRVLGEIRENHGVEEALRHTLSHEDSRVRKETVRALSMIRGPETPSLLLNALNDRDKDVVELAVVSIGLLKDENAVQPLADLVEGNEENGVKREALKALGRIGSRKAVSFLIKVFNRRSWLTGKREDDIKVQCVAALADAGTPEAIKALESGLTSTRKVVNKACEDVLKRIKHG